MKLLEDIFNLTPKQIGFITNIHKYPYCLMYGPRGTTKSHALVSIAAYLNIYHALAGQQINGALVAATRVDAQKKLVPLVKKILVGKGLGELVGSSSKEESPTFFRFFNPNYGKIYFLGAENPESWRGIELAYICMDELTQIPEENFQFITTSVRYSGKLILPHQPIIAACNPEGPYAPWVYSYFIKKDFNTPLGRNCDINEYYSELFTIDDHPNENFIKTNRKRLEQLPDHRRLALLDGIWTQSLGARFKLKDEQVINDFPIPSNWTRVVGIDWGIRDETFIIFLAMNPHDPNNLLYLYDSITVTDTSVSTVAKLIKDRVGTDAIHSYEADPSMWNREPAALRTLTDYFKDYGIYLTASLRTPEQRNAAIDHLLPNLRIFRSSEKVARDLQAMRFNPKGNPEDLIPHSQSHSVCAVAYALNKCHGFSGKTPLTEEQLRLQEEERNLARILSNKTRNTL